MNESMNKKEQLIDKAKLTEEEFKKITQEPTKDYVEKTNKISSDGKNLLVRIPREIVDILKINKGDKLKFFVEMKEGKKPKKIEVSIIQ